MKMAIEKGNSFIPQMTQTAAPICGQSMEYFLQILQTLHLTLLIPIYTFITKISL